MRKERTHYTTEEKVAILKRHLLETKLIPSEGAQPERNTLIVEIKGSTSGSRSQRFGSAGPIAFVKSGRDIFIEHCQARMHGLKRLPRLRASAAAFDVSQTIGGRNSAFD